MRSALSGTKRSDGRWQIVLTLTEAGGGKKRKTIYGVSQREVQERAREFVQTNGRRQPRGETLNDIWGDWERTEWGRLAEKSRVNHNWCKTRILGAFGKKKPSDVKSPDVWRWMTAISLEISGRSVQIHRNCLSVFYRFMLREGIASQNPCEGLGLPVATKPKTRHAMTGAMARLTWMKEPDPVLRDLWKTLALCGLRPAEALALTSDHLVRMHKGWWLDVPGTKTDAAPRKVPVPHALGESLATRQGWLFPDPKEDRALLFRHVSTLWRRALKRANIEHTNLYQLRKLCITRWVAMGLPDEVVKSLAGHSSIVLTKNVYARVTTGRISTAFRHSGVSGRYVGIAENLREDVAQVQNGSLLTDSNR